MCCRPLGGADSLTQFEFFWAFYGLLLGLAVAELLSGFASLLRESAPPRLGLVTPLLGAQILVEMLATYVDAWRSFQGLGVSLADFALPTLIGLLYFVAAVIIIPRRLSDWGSLDDYFDKRRKWIVGTLLLANMMATISVFPDWLGRLSQSVVWIGIFVVQIGSLLGAYTLLLLTRSRRRSVAAILFLMFWYFLFYGPFDLRPAFVALVG